jgi:hypothetical protein
MADVISQDEHKGYTGQALDIIQKWNVRVWSDAEIETTRGTFRGIVLPRAENTDDYHIVIKVDTGYNIGIDIGTINSITEIGYRKANYKTGKRFPFDPQKPWSGSSERVEQLPQGSTTERVPLSLPLVRVNSMAVFRNLLI